MKPPDKAAIGDRYVYRGRADSFPGVVIEVFPETDWRHSQVTIFWEETKASSIYTVSNREDVWARCHVVYSLENPYDLNPLS